jgi:hypothetical protein
VGILGPGLHPRQKKADLRFHILERHGDLSRYMMST